MLAAKIRIPWNGITTAGGALHSHGRFYSEQNPPLSRGYQRICVHCSSFQKQSLIVCSAAAVIALELL